MTEPEKNKAHEELLALYEDTTRNIDNFKKDGRIYLVYYTALAGAIIIAHEQASPHYMPGIIFWFVIGACLCRLLIWDMYNRIHQRRWTLRRIFETFSTTFREARDPDDLDLKKVTDKGPVDYLVYHMQLLHPFVVLALTWRWLYPAELDWLEILTLTPVGILWDLVFLDEQYFAVIPVKASIRKNKCFIFAKTLLGVLVPVLALIEMT